MTDISVIILVGNEELHIRRCLERIAAIEPKQVIVVESQRGDSTHEIASSMGAICVWHDWPGNQAAQFEWALKTLKIDGGWILRLDADEYLTDALVEEIKGKLPTLDDNVAGVVFKRRHMWSGKWIKRGMYPTKILRLFRCGRGSSDGKLMDEHIVVSGSVVEFNYDFVDDSLITIDEWEKKHRQYAKREARSFLSGERSSGSKAILKWMYYHILPSAIRPWIYYIKRAFISGAFFESPEARDFTFRHALWYRMLVEREIKLLRREKGMFSVFDDFMQADMESYDRIIHSQE